MEGVAEPWEASLCGTFYDACENGCQPRVNVKRKGMALQEGLVTVAMVYLVASWE
jgi:hypothetical protein